MRVLAVLSAVLWLVAPSARLLDVAETEPNDLVGTANAITVADRATGTMNPEGDVDAWVVELAAGQFVSIDLDAQSLGSPLDSRLALIAPDGTTQLAFNDDADGQDSRISYRITASGRYYVLVGSFGNVGGPELRYALRFGTVACGAVGTEHEPNGTPGGATPIAVGQSGQGEICPQGDAAEDLDYWAFTAYAGTAVELDVDAATADVLVDPFLVLYASDGTTELSFNDNFNGRDPKLRFAIATTGTYFARVTERGHPGANPFAYTLHVHPVVPGPGDPITVIGQSLGQPMGLAVGGTGDLFAGDFAGNRIVRVSLTGEATTFAAGITSPLGLAFDAFGNLLVASASGIVYRVTPAGQVNPLITDTGLPFWIAVARDGRIWVSDILNQSLRRYSPTGQFEARLDVADAGGFGPSTMAFSPTGQLYFSNGNQIWRVDNGQLRHVLTEPSVIWGFAFDDAGRIYVALPQIAALKLFDSTGTRLVDLFTVSAASPQAVAFGRDVTGATNARLFVSERSIGRLIELNPAGVLRPGLPVGHMAPPVAVDVAAAALLGGAGLSPADRQYLDEIGNHNGRYDIGDLQAYLRTLGVLHAAVTAPLGPRSDR